MEFKSVQHFEFELKIETDIDPAEPQTRDYPGSDACVHINSISLRGMDIPLSLFTQSELDTLRDDILSEAAHQERERDEAARDRETDRQIDEYKERRAFGRK